MQVLYLIVVRIVSACQPMIVFDILITLKENKCK